MQFRPALLATFAAPLLACSPTAAYAATFTGTARSIDGDSLKVGAREVRLFGIDAPEYSQTCQRGGQTWRCGTEAAARLSALVTGRQVRCSTVDMDEHSRTVARCSVGSTDVNRQMVASGFAVAYRRYSTDYVSAEGSAKAAKRGIWSGTFQMPSDVRRADDRRSAQPAGRSSGPAQSSARRPRAEAQAGCSIKGNRGTNGWIYHVPGMPFYARTRAEQMFCSEAEARAAGYRRAKVR